MWSLRIIASACHLRLLVNRGSTVSAGQATAVTRCSLITAWASWLMITEAGVADAWLRIKVCL